MAMDGTDDLSAWLIAQARRRAHQILPAVAARESSPLHPHASTDPAARAYDITALHVQP